MKYPHRAGWLSLFASGALSFAISSAQDPLPKGDMRLPGMQASGQMLLPTQWSLQPAGKQLSVGDFPVAIAMHPKSQFAAVLHAGYGDTKS